MGNRTINKSRINKLTFATALLLAPMLAALWTVPAAHAHGDRGHESPKQTPAVPTATRVPIADHTESAIHDGRPEPEKPNPAIQHREEQASDAPTAHPYPPEGVPRPLAWLGKFHPMAIHFPIAMILAAAFSELLLIRTRHELFFHATRFAIWVGAIGAFTSATLGWFFAGFRIFDTEWLMTTHRWLGTFASAFALVVLFLCERAYQSSDRRAFRLALFPLAVVVATTGFFGGTLIYGLDHYAW